MALRTDLGPAKKIPFGGIRSGVLELANIKIAVLERDLKDEKAESARQITLAAKALLERDENSLKIEELKEKLKSKCDNCECNGVTTRWCHDCWEEWYVFNFCPDCPDSDVEEVIQTAAVTMPVTIQATTIENTESSEDSDDSDDSDNIDDTTLHRRHGRRRRTGWRCIFPCLMNPQCYQS